MSTRYSTILYKEGRKDGGEEVGQSNILCYSEQEGRRRGSRGAGWQNRKDSVVGEAPEDRRR